MVDEDFIQRGLLFKDRLPQISSGQPDNIAVQTSFGWTEDDATVDDTISVDSPRWRAALGNNTVQAAGSLSNSAWHDGSAVSFTIDNLRETLTKNLQPLTQVPIGLRAKTYESNKTLGYAVQAQALALFRYYDMTDSGSVPGFRRDAILSNFHQTPLQAKPGTPVVFEFDINAINFESGNPSINFGLSEDPQTAEYAFFSHGELSEIDTGWHVRVPWTATSLSPPTGLVTVVVSETSDPRKAATAEQSFQVSLDQQNRSTRVAIADVSPNPLVITETGSNRLRIKGSVTATGYVRPNFKATVTYLDQRGTPVLESPLILLPTLSSNGESVVEFDHSEDLSLLQGISTANMTVRVNASADDCSNAPTSTISAKALESEPVCTDMTDGTQQVVVEVQNHQSPSLGVFEQSELGSLTPLASSEDLRAGTATDLAIERRGNIFPYGLPGCSNKLFVQVQGLQFDATGVEPETVNVTLQGDLSKSAVPLTLNRRDRFYEGIAPVTATLVRPKSGLVGSPGTTFSTGEATIIKAAVDGNNIFTSMMRLLPDGILLSPPHLSYQKPSQTLGRFRLKSKFTESNALPDSTEALFSVKNIVNTGFEDVSIVLDPASNKGLKTEKLEARLKIRQPAEMLLLNAHGGIDGSLLAEDGALTPQFMKDSGVFDPSKPDALKTLMLLSCKALDFYDFNNNHSDVQQTLTSRPAPGLNWWKACGGKTALLGYNNTVLGLGAFLATPRYLAEVKRLSEAGVPHSEVQQLAWLSANVSSAINQGRPAVLAACAWSETNYYYIALSRPLASVYGSAEQEDREEVASGAIQPRVIRGVYRVPVNSSGAAEALRPREGLAPVGAYEVTIPELSLEVK